MNNGTEQAPPADDRQEDDSSAQTPAEEGWIPAEEWPAVPRKTVTWRGLKASPTHKTSYPTNEAIRRLIGEVQAARGKRPTADSIIFAAVRLAARGDLRLLLDEVQEIEIANYLADPPHDPGE